MKKILFTWIGKTDLEAEKLQNDGPVLAALKKLKPDEVELLSNYPRDQTNKYIGWLKRMTTASLQLHHVKLSSPTNYAEIYPAATRVITKARERTGNAQFKPYYHLSPGTPAMAATWIILCSSFCKGELIETSTQRGFQFVKLPYEIAAEFVPLHGTGPIQEALLLGLTEVSAEFADIIHRSYQMREVIFEAQHLAGYDVPVLIMGASGTGKELFATAIRNASPRKDGPFKKINCGAIPENLFESEFFGYKKGAFTGAIADKKGLFEETDGGTLFLDEIGELPPFMQVKLLRAIQEKEVTRIGATTPHKFNVRIIAATNRDLLSEVADGRFREDLFHRLAHGILKIPALKDRTGDIGLLVDHFINKEREALNKPKLAIKSEARNILINHPWPGNVRELSNTISRCALWCMTDKITAKDVEKQILQIPKKDALSLDTALGGDFNIKEFLDRITKSYVSRALKESGSNQSKAAKLLGLKNYQTFANWKNKYLG
ncbi:MAG: sigma 54-interacting transcriptional regulator [Deltaproteobacteria bacterium]|nr:sigma 54-interacting transcriptional regulator [Deltaproteobacteria bacterium]